jgi:hypothetical protein
MRLPRLLLKKDPSQQKPTNQPTAPLLGVRAPELPSSSLPGTSRGEETKPFEQPPALAEMPQSESIKTMKDLALRGQEVIPTKGGSSASRLQALIPNLPNLIQQMKNKPSLAALDEFERMIRLMEPPNVNVTLQRIEALRTELETSPPDVAWRRLFEALFADVQQPDKLSVNQRLFLSAIAQNFAGGFVLASSEPLTALMSPLAAIGGVHAGQLAAWGLHLMSDHYPSETLNGLHSHPSATGFATFTDFEQFVNDNQKKFERGEITMRQRDASTFLFHHTRPDAIHSPVPGDVNSYLPIEEYNRLQLPELAKAAEGMSTSAGLGPVAGLQGLRHIFQAAFSLTTGVGYIMHKNGHLPPDQVALAHNLLYGWFGTTRAEHNLHHRNDDHDEKFGVFSARLDTVLEAHEVPRLSFLSKYLADGVPPTGWRNNPELAEEVLGFEKGSLTTAHEAAIAKHAYASAVGRLQKHSTAELKARNLNDPSDSEKIAIALTIETSHLAETVRRDIEAVLDGPVPEKAIHLLQALRRKVDGVDMTDEQAAHVISGGPFERKFAEDLIPWTSSEAWPKLSRRQAFDAYARLAGQVGKNAVDLAKGAFGVGKTSATE